MCALQIFIIIIIIIIGGRTANCACAIDVKHKIKN